MTGERENDRCYHCGGRLESKLATLPFVIGNNVVVIKNIPAEVCTQCNEPIMSSTVSQHIDKLLKQARRSGFEVSIVAYSQPAMAEV